MAENQVQRAWEEREVLPESGTRIVHYILRDTAGNSLLAAVGTERSIRHMFYSVSADFLRAFGSTSTINAETRWKARREVVEWLISIVTKKGPIFPNSGQRVTGQTPSLQYPNSSVARLSSCKNPMAGEGSKKSAFENSEIVWSGEAWVCSKQLKHYPSFCRSGINIAAYSFVCIMGEEEREYLAHVEDLYEDSHGKKMVRVRWFNFLKDIEDLVSDIETHNREVFMTPHEQDISAECINGLATVLMPNHFEKCLKFIPEFMSSETFLCHREVRSKKIKHFSLSQLHGYSSQPVLSCLISHVQNLPEEEGFDQPKSVANEPQHCLSFKVNDNIELLSQDSGLQGCWFRCKVLRVSQKRLKVQYYDVLDVDGPDKLEEWVPSQRVANPDKLGIRHAGRLMIRPWSSDNKSDSTTFNVGSAVDAWWNDGWWEGIVIGYQTASLNGIQVFFPGENKFLTVERKNIRASRDWIDGKWTNIKPNPNILSFISSILSPTPKPAPLPILAGTSTQGVQKIQGPKDSAPSSSGAVKPKANEELHYKKQLMIRDREERAGKNSDKLEKMVLKP